MFRVDGSSYRREEDKGRQGEEGQVLRQFWNSSILADSIRREFFRFSRVVRILLHPFKNFPKDSTPKKESTPKDPAQKEETTSKDSTLKKDPAPDKSDAVKSKQAGTTSDVPTDMVSEAKETDQ